MNGKARTTCFSHELTKMYCNIRPDTGLCADSGWPTWTHDDTALRLRMPLLLWITTYFEKG